MKAGQVTSSFISYRLTDADAGVDSWQAEAFGLLVAERFYPDLVRNCKHLRSDDYGFFRRRLNLVWSVLEKPSIREPGYISDRDLDAISLRIPDSRQDGATGARAVAAATMCLYLNHFVQSRDQDSIARLALSAYAGVFVDQSIDLLSGRTSWAASIPFDEIPAYENSIATAPGVQSELLLQDADLSFVETLKGPLQQRFTAVVRRAFAGQIPERFRAT